MKYRRQPTGARTRTCNQALQRDEQLEQRLYARDFVIAYGRADFV